MDSRFYRVLVSSLQPFLFASVSSPIVEGMRNAAMYRRKLWLTEHHLCGCYTRDKCVSVLIEFFADPLRRGNKASDEMRLLMQEFTDGVIIGIAIVLEYLRVLQMQCLNLLDSIRNGTTIGDVPWYLHVCHQPPRGDGVEEEYLVDMTD